MVRLVDDAFMCFHEHEIVFTQVVADVEVDDAIERLKCKTSKMRMDAEISDAESF